MRSAEDSASGGEAEEWLTRYAAELGHAPTSPEQLRAFALHRGGHILYGAARRAIEGQPAPASLSMVARRAVTEQSAATLRDGDVYLGMDRVGSAPVDRSAVGPPPSRPPPSLRAARPPPARRHPAGAVPARGDHSPRSTADSWHLPSENEIRGRHERVTWTAPSSRQGYRGADVAAVAALRASVEASRPTGIVGSLVAERAERFGGQARRLEFWRHLGDSLGVPEARRGRWRHLGDSLGSGREGLGPAADALARRLALFHSERPAAEESFVRQLLGLVREAEARTQAQMRARSEAAVARIKDQLPATPAAEVGDEVECAICLSSGAGDDDCACWRGLPCGHRYHEGCLLEWVRRATHRACPLCRLDLDLALGLPPEAAAEESEDDTGIISSGLSEEVLEESPRASRSPTRPPRVGWEDEVASMFAEEQRELRARAERELTRRTPSSLSAVSDLVAGSTFVTRI